MCIRQPVNLPCDESRGVAQFGNDPKNKIHHADFKIYTRHRVSQPNRTEPNLQDYWLRWVESSDATLSKYKTSSPVTVCYFY